MNVQSCYKKDKNNKTRDLAIEIRSIFDGYKMNQITFLVKNLVAE